jgi:hypothetical protein
MNLRKYKQTSKFTADMPWQYPVAPTYRPEIALKGLKNDIPGGTLRLSSKFVDRFDEKNVSLIMPLVDNDMHPGTTTCYE